MFKYVSLVFLCLAKIFAVEQIEKEKFLIQKINGNSHYIMLDERDKINFQKELFNEQDYSLSFLQVDFRGYFYHVDSIVSYQKKKESKKKKSKGLCPGCRFATDENGICKNIRCTFCGMEVV